MESKTFSIQEAMTTGYQVTRGFFWSFASILLFMGVIIILLNLLIQWLGAGQQKPITALVLNIFAVIVQITFAMGLIHVSLGALAKKEPTFGETLAPLPLAGHFLLAEILSGLISVGLLLVVFLLYAFLRFTGTTSQEVNIVLGLFVILGVFFAILFSVRFKFAGYFVIERGVGPVTAIKESFRITQGNFWKLLWFWMLLGLLNFLGALAFLVGLFLTIPISLVASVLVYKKLAS